MDTIKDLTIAKVTNNLASGNLTINKITNESDSGNLIINNPNSSFNKDGYKYIAKSYNPEDNSEERKIERAKWKTLCKLTLSQGTWIVTGIMYIGSITDSSSVTKMNIVKSYENIANNQDTLYSTNSDLSHQIIDIIKISNPNGEQIYLNGWIDKNEEIDFTSMKAIRIGGNQNERLDTSSSNQSY